MNRMIMIASIGKAIIPAFAEVLRKAPQASTAEWTLAASVAVGGAIALIAIDVVAARLERKKSLNPVKRS